MKVLAISSAGGHWEQLVTIRDSFLGHDVLYASTSAAAAGEIGVRHLAVIRDCNRDTPLAIGHSVRDVFKLVRDFRPDFVITTGAAPGLFAIIVGRLFGARGVWIDSIANSERLSLSGRVASLFADLHLTQWEHLSSPDGPKHLGSVL